MVMHARKLPRINDGFSDKHQTHGYENSKYSNKYRYGNHEKSRDSPSTNSLRSSSPDSRSQSPRYHKSNYYKVREKERERENRDRDREREREREYKDYRDRDGSRSPKDRRREIRDRERERDRDREHRDSRGIHERINSVHKKEEKERLMRVGEWSEHVSSSGKKYYYNCRTEVSQWEKPPEWLEWERNHRGSSSAVPSGANHSCKETSLSSVNIHRGQHDKNRQDKHSTISDGYRDLRDPERDRREFRNDDHYERRETRKYGQDVGTADMEISSGDSTPTSESLHGRSAVDGSHEASAGNNLSSSTSNIHIGSSSHFPRPISKISLSGLGPPSASISSTLPGSGTTTISTINSHNNNTVGAPGTSGSLGNSAPPAVPQLLNSHPRLMALSSNFISSSDSKGGGMSNSISNSLIHHQDGEGAINSGSKLQLEPLTIMANSNSIGAGPPTPTHSENQDGLDIRKIGSPNSSLNSLQSLSQNSTSSLSLTPSLANYYKEQLISHVQTWPAEAIEKQCHRLSEEAHTIGSLIMTKVSADLKMARSLVRLAEIQATLHEQRILFLRAQKRELEEVKAQNCFMNDT